MKCPQCGKRGLKGPQGLAMHVGRVHDLTILPPYTQAAVALGGKKYRKPRRIVQVENHADHEEPSAGSVAVLTRTTTRRAEETVTEQAIVPVQQFMVNGCPHCLNPLKPMNDGYSRAGIAIPPFCPFCKCPVGAVRTALRIVDKATAHKPTELVPV